MSLARWFQICLLVAALGSACGGRSQLPFGESDETGGLSGLGGVSAGGTPSGGAFAGDGSPRGGATGGPGGVATGGFAGSGSGGVAVAGHSGFGMGGAATAGAGAGGAGVAGAAGAGAGGGPLDLVIESVTLGSLHTCAVSSARTARCWGENAEGQLGLAGVARVGDDETPAEARDIDLGGPVVSLSAGAMHTCALLASGGVRCFGRNGEGQLGYAHTRNIGDDETPASAGDVDLGGRVVQLAAGSYHTCALLESGAVRCWGQGNRGELGHGNTQNLGDDETPASAGDVDVGGLAIEIRAGLFHSCALLDTRKVRCWGYARQGRLGYGNTNDIGDDEAPASAGDVDVGGDVLHIDLGGYHTCALLTSADLRCWGGGFYGESGHGNQDPVGDDETPASVPLVTVGDPVVEVSTGIHHTCALGPNGGVRCWGDGFYGQLGYGNRDRIGDNEAVAVGDIELGEPAVQIASGGIHTCALARSGALRCWGGSSSGQLGYGNTNNVGDDETPASAGEVRVFR